MNKVIATFLFFAMAFMVSIAKLYRTPIGFEPISYHDYRDQFSENLKDPIIERYRNLAVEQPIEE